MRVGFAPRCKRHGLPFAAGCASSSAAPILRRAAGAAAKAVAPETALAAPARRFTSVVDLTHTMSPEFPTFFGVPGIEMDKKFELKKDGFNLYWWRIVEHAGTHLDAPIHFSESGATVEKISADTLVVPLAVVDVAAKAAQNPDYLLTREDLADWERSAAGCRTIVAWRCNPAGRSTWATRPNSPAKTAPASSTSPASARRRPNG